jgi:hypothetical protein
MIGDYVMGKNKVFIVILARGTIISTVLFAHNLAPTLTTIYQLFLPAAENEKIPS